MEIAGALNAMPTNKDSLFIGSFLDSKSQASLADHSLEELQFSSTFRYQHTKEHTDKLEIGNAYSLEVHRILDVIEHTGGNGTTGRATQCGCVERKFMGKDIERYSRVEYNGTPVTKEVEPAKKPQSRYACILPCWFKRATRLTGT